jgi:hypothetical protein
VERGGVVGSQPVNAAVHRSQIYFRDLTPYLTYDSYEVSQRAYFYDTVYMHGVRGI